MGNLLHGFPRQLPDKRAPLTTLDSKTFDPTTTLLTNDVTECVHKVGGDSVKILKVRLKYQKEDQTGVTVELIPTDSFSCPLTAFEKWKNFAKLNDLLNSPASRGRGIIFLSLSTLLNCPVSTPSQKPGLQCTFLHCTLLPAHLTAGAHILLMYSADAKELYVIMKICLVLSE